MCWMVAREVITPAPEGIAGTFTCRNDFFCLRGKTPALKTWHTCNFFLLVWSHESKSVPPTQRQHMWIIDAFLIVCLLPSSHTHHDVQILLASDIFKGPSWGGKTAAVCLMEGQTGPKHTAPSPIFATKWAFYLLSLLSSAFPLKQKSLVWMIQISEFHPLLKSETH